MMSSQSWSFAAKLSFRFIFVFVILFIPSFSFEHEFIPDTGKFLAPFYERLAAWTGKTFFHCSDSCTYEIASDSAGFYLHALNLLFISAIVAVIWSALDKKRNNYQQLAYWFFVLIRFYLAMQLFSYGFNKIFKWQFYLPEPNTLYTTVGNMPRDLLYWSSMGTSRFYVVFSGMMELIAAALLLFRRTYMAGALIALMVMLNVLMINFGFDISVKLYSLFLVLLCLVLLIPESKRLFNFFFSRKPASLEKWKPEFTKRNSRIFLVVKIMIIAVIIFDPLSLYLRTKNFNDDLAPRPALHGAYDVTLFVKNSDTLLPLLTDQQRWKRIFIHRRGYLITQLMNDEMADYNLYVDTTRKKLMMENANERSYLNYTIKNDSVLIVDGNFFGDTLNLELKKIDLKKLPLLQNEFHWTIDQ